MTDPWINPLLRHGLPATYARRGCRCAACTAANADAARVARRRRYATRVEVDGRLVAVALPPEYHGLKTTYNNWGCRCRPCTAANARYKRRRGRGRTDGTDGTEENGVRT